MCNENPKSINGLKRKSLETILAATKMLYAININRADANIELFKSIVTELAIHANELIILANSFESKNED